MDALEENGHQLTVTLREFGMTRDLMESSSRPYTLIGGPYGGSLPSKVAGLGVRVGKLFIWARDKEFDVAASHGSRSQVIAARMLGIPSLSMYDYEHVATGIFDRFSTRVLVPAVLEDRDLLSGGLAKGRYVRYPGQKEDVYLGGLQPDPTILSDLDIDPAAILVVLRPPATSAHYHAKGGEEIFEACVSHVLKVDKAMALVVPRTEEEGRRLCRNLQNPMNLRILSRPVDGLNLIWHADMVCGGGGTMNREAARLGTPVYSLFLGKLGAVDRDLAARGKMHLIRSIEDVTHIKVRKKDPPDIEAERQDREARSLVMIRLVTSQILSLAWN
jgi:predicted glycosyltransferase